MKRRVVSFILAAVMVTGTIFQSFVPSFSAAVQQTGKNGTETKDGNLNYFSNQGKLNADAFVQLPMGAVTAKDWLLQQLYLQKNGLTGAIHDNYELYGPNNGWRGGTGDGWEKGVYYLRGLAATAFVLDDSELIEDAMEWIDFILNNQRSNGFMGPLNDGDGSSNNWDWWPRMVALQVIRDYYEVTEQKGNPDERVLPFLDKYFRYQRTRLPGKPLESWAASRGGDNIEVLLWYYNRVFDANNPTDTDWIIDLAILLAGQTKSQDSGLNWIDVFNTTTVREHVVNTTQAMKTPAVLSQLPGRESDKDALKQGIFNMGLDHGRVDNLANSDEAARDNLPYRGAELCSIVESLLSNEMSLRISGESWLGDEMERSAYNSLPAGYAPDYTGHCYFQAQNQVMATHGNHEFDCEHGDDSAFGAPTGFECCFPNMHMGWPKFIQNMWMATRDSGLAVIAYGPNKVTAQVADGKTAVFSQTTDYPFKDTIFLDYSGETAGFPLKLRLPSWCDSPSITVNGAPVDLTSENGFVSIDRTWTANDKVVVKFPMEVRTSTWYNNSEAVEYGPLIFALKVEEDWRIASDDAAREIQSTPIGEFDRKEVYPASDWNYALVRDPDNPESSFEIETADQIGLQPFTLSNAPITIKATGQKVPQWQLKGNVVPEPPYSPLKEDINLQEEIELVPYACTRLRITLMPTIGEAPENGIISRDLEDADVYTDDGSKVVEFDNLVVPNAEEYKLKVSFTGSGTLKVNVNQKYEEEMEFTGSELTIENLTAIVPGINKYFHFGYGKYNNIRFYGNDNVNITKIEIIPENLFTNPEIKDAVISNDGKSVTLNTNIDRASGFYTINYGTESGVYSKSASNFYEKKAVITGLEPEETYYFQVSMLVNGVETVSEEVAGVPGFVQPLSFVDDFSSPSKSKDLWTLYDPDSVVSFREGKMSFGRSSNVKAVTGSQEWTDYAVVAEVVGTGNPDRDFGIMLRASGVKDGADGYNGYYVGINAKSGGLNIGYADGSWHDIATPGGVTYQENKVYELKTIIVGERLAVYVDGVKLYDEKISDMVSNGSRVPLFESGCAGLRSWNQSFDVNYFEVREISAEEYEDLGIENNSLFPAEDPETPVEVIAEFEDDFENEVQSAEKWRLCGDKSKMSINNGKLAMSSSNNVKAVAGDEAWKNYVVEASIALDGTSTQNAGIMYRVTNVGENGSDNYYGNYFGIGNNSNGTGYYIIGYAQNNWNQTERKDMAAFENGKEYRLKAVVYEDFVALYIDDKLITKFIDTRFEKGMIGLRSYEKAFTVDNVTVRSVREEDLAPFEGMTRFIDETFGACKTVQLKFPKFSSTRDYKIVYGTEPGVYTSEVYGLYHSHSGSKSDKLSISVPENDRDYYLRIIGLNGKEETLVSDEVVVHTGERYDITQDMDNLKTCLQEASKMNKTGYTKVSLERLNWAITNANKVISNTNSNLIDVRLAKNSILVGMNELVKGASLEKIEITPPTKTVYKTGETLDLTGIKVTAVYSDDSRKVLNSSDYMVSGFSSAAAGKVSVTVSYTDGGITKTTSFIVDVQKSDPPVAVDKKALQAVYNSVKNLSGSIYTTQSWAAFQKALNNAKTVLADSKTTQKQVDDAAAALQKAKQNLKTRIQINASYVHKGLKYKVTSVKSGKSEVRIVGAVNKNKTKIIIPSTISLNGVKCKVTAIGAKAFKNFKKLNYVKIGTNIKSIGKQAFYKDGRLKKIVIKSTVLKSVGSKALKGINAKAVITVPKAKKNKYVKLFKNRGQKSTVKIK